MGNIAASFSTYIHVYKVWNIDLPN